jgi:Uma2 family endonuclease
MTAKTQKVARRTTAPDMVFSAANLYRTMKQGQSVYLTGLTWEEYVALQEELGDLRPRITFDNGRLEIMPISQLHEAIAWLLNALLTIWADEFDLPFCAGGQMTFSRRDLAKGFNPDHCYWLAHAPQVERKRRINLRRDPPPDLALEIEVTRTVINRLTLYAALKVPEVWRCTSDGIEVGLLQPDGKYSWGNESHVVPGIPLDELAKAIKHIRKRKQLALLRQFRAWVREHRETN